MPWRVSERRLWRLMESQLELKLDLLLLRLRSKCRHVPQQLTDCATVLAKTCCTGTAAAAALAAVAVVVTESCRRFVAERGSRVSTVDCGSLHDNAPRRICMRAATT